MKVSSAEVTPFLVGLGTSLALGQVTLNVVNDGSPVTADRANLTVIGLGTGVAAIAGVRALQSGVAVRALLTLGTTGGLVMGAGATAFAAGDKPTPGEDISGSPQTSDGEAPSADTDDLLESIGDPDEIAPPNEDPTDVPPPADDSATSDAPATPAAEPSETATPAEEPAGASESTPPTAEDAPSADPTTSPSDASDTPTTAPSDDAPSPPADAPPQGDRTAPDSSEPHGSARKPKEGRAHGAVGRVLDAGKNLIVPPEPHIPTEPTEPYPASTFEDGWSGDVYRFLDTVAGSDDDTKAPNVIGSTFGFLGSALGMR